MSDQTKDDALYAKAVDLVITRQTASVSLMQRALRIGFSQACGYLDEMQALGIISAPDKHGQRAVLKSDLDEQPTQMIAGVLFTKASNGDVVCVAHGTAIDVHCCHCHSGFIFDAEHECPDAAN